MATYLKPDQDVIDLVDEMLEKYHPHLEEARIGILMRDEAPNTGGHVTYGQAKKVTDEMRAAGVDYHFIVWFALDTWLELTPAQRAALVDHELCHCIFYADEEKAKIRPHDFEEFNVVIARHGLWWPGADATQEAISGHQMPLFGRSGKVEAIAKPAALAPALS